MTKNKKTPLVIVLSIFLLIGGSYIIARLNTKVIDNEDRSSALNSEFVQLSQGITQYQSAGSNNGKTILFVSGFSVSYDCWDPVFYTLISEGYRVIRYNHYGRGLSESVSVEYTQELFVNQLSELISVLNLTKPLYFLGLSMGGLISAQFTIEHKDLVSKLVLISPSGFPIKESFASKLTKIPLLGDYILQVFGNNILAARNSSNLYAAEKYPEFQEQFELQLESRGFKKALLSTLRNFPFTNSPEVYSRLGNTNVPVLLFWGEFDQVIPFEQAELVSSAIPQAKFIKIEGAGHNSQYETPEKMLPELLKFLNK